jgi:hypothetical protein
VHRIVLPVQQISVVRARPGASQSRWVNQYYCFLREATSGFRGSCAKVPAQHRNWIGIVVVSNAATDVIHASALKRRRVARDAEFWIAEIKFRASSVGEWTRRVGFKEAPNIQILDSRLPIAVVQGGTLAQCDCE